MDSKVSPSSNFTVENQLSIAALSRQLPREEHALALRSARAIRDRLHDEHVALGTMLVHLREDASDASSTGRDLEAVECRLFAELAQLDRQLAAQIAVEERMLSALPTQGEPT